MFNAKEYARNWYDENGDARMDRCLWCRAQKLEASSALCPRCEYELVRFDGFDLTPYEKRMFEQDLRRFPQDTYPGVAVKRHIDRTMYKRRLFHTALAQEAMTNEGAPPAPGE